MFCLVDLNEMNVIVETKGGTVERVEVANIKTFTLVRFNVNKIVHPVLLRKVVVQCIVLFLCVLIAACLLMPVVLNLFKPRTVFGPV